MKVDNLRPGDQVKMDGFRNPVIFREKKLQRYVFQCPAWKGEGGMDDLGLFELSKRQVINLCS